MQKLTLTDRDNFYIPADVETETAVYQRVSNGGWNSVCLPFAFSESDFDSDVKIYTIKTIEDKDGSNVIVLTRKREVEPGEPCYAYFEQDVTGWNLNIGASKVAANVTPVSSLDGSLRINGSFTNKAIGANKYKINDAGTAFGKTTELGKVVAFRSYIETIGNNSSSFLLRIVDSTTDIEGQVIDHVLENGKIYDLNGRQMTAPIKGQPYILNGKVHLDR